MITIGFFGYIGYLLSAMERPAIMENWNSTRCNVLVMFAASYFKPDSDPRTPGEFSTDNFSFCMKGIVQDVMAVVMAPFMDLFQDQASSTNYITEMMNGIREIITVVYNQFLSFIEPFLLKFTAITYQIGIKMQHIRSAFRRVSAMALSTVFSGLSIIRGVQNAIDFVIKIVMIILIVLVVLIILLFFILFPFLPLILSVIAVIVAVGTASVAASAGGMNGTFCFEPSTRIQTLSGASVAISELKLGDCLGDGGVVTGILVLDGSTSPLYTLNGIQVSGSHLVLGKEGEWRPVREDPGAVLSGYTAPILYCLNTSTHKIPVVATGGTLRWFRDWEEMEDDDEDAHREWNAHVSSLLGGVKDDGAALDAFCLMDPNHQVLSMHRGLLPIHEVVMGDVLYLDAIGRRTTTVIGLVSGLTGGASAYRREWMSSCIVQQDFDAWARTTTLTPGSTPLRGAHLITDTGLLRLITSTGPLLLRDMTETGADRLHETYDFVLRSLRPKDLKNKSSSTTETA